MGLYNKLPEDIWEVDVIIAGGPYVFMLRCLPFQRFGSDIFILFPNDADNLHQVELLHVSSRPGSPMRTPSFPCCS